MLRTPRLIKAALEFQMKNYIKATFSLYSFAIVMVALAIIPFVNFFLYSGHGGIGWLILPASLPFALIKLWLKLKQGGEVRAFYKKFSLVSLPIYFVLAVPLSYAAVYSIEQTMGLEAKATEFYALLTMPFGALLFFV